jgi:hypothetical protein
MKEKIMQINTPSGGFNGYLQNQKRINLGAGTAATDGVNKGQVDTALAAKISTSARGAANGVAALDAGGKVPTTQIPSPAYAPTSVKGQANGVATLDSSGKFSASQLRAQQSSFAHRLSASGSVDLNSTAEQAIDIAHGNAAKPPFAKVIALGVIQDNLTINTSALCWAAGYPVYDDAASTNTNARVLVKFSTAAGVAATGTCPHLLRTVRLTHGCIEPRRRPRQARSLVVPGAPGCLGTPRRPRRRCGRLVQRLRRSQGSADSSF